MNALEQFTQPGEHNFYFRGELDNLQGIISIPSLPIKSNHVAILGHPHSLQGGTMNNKVVTTLARAFKELGIISIRFNFRGVGESSGTYDKGIGESLDMLQLITLCKQTYPAAALILAGFSFGSYVAYRAAQDSDPALLISVAPPVNHYSFLAPFPANWTIIHGDQDEVVPFAEALAFSKMHQPPIELIEFHETTHFFHGKLVQLKTTIMSIVENRVLVK